MKSYKNLKNLIETANQVTSGEFQMLNELFDNPYKIEMKKITHPSVLRPNSTSHGGAQFRTDNGGMNGVSIHYTRLMSGAIQLHIDFNLVKLISKKEGESDRTQTKYADNSLKMDGDVSKVVSTVYAATKHYIKYLEPSSVKLSIKHEDEDEKVLKFMGEAISHLAKKEGLKEPKISKTSKTLNFTIKTAKNFPKQYYIFGAKSRKVLFGPDSYSNCQKEKESDRKLPWEQQKYVNSGTYNPEKKKKMGDKMTDADLRNFKDKGVYSELYYKE